MHVLRVLAGPNQGAVIRLPPDEPQLIGRSSEALPISDTAVSRRHAELTPDRGSWFVRDLDSANGTFVNGVAIVSRTPLAPGDELRVGSTTFLFSAEPEQVGESPIKLLDGDEIEDAVTSRIPADQGPGGRGGASGGTTGTTGTTAGGAAAGAATEDALRLAQEHLRVIYALTEITSSALTKEDLLTRALDLLFREFNPERGFILLQPEGSTRLIPAAVRYRVRPRTADEGHIPVSRTIIQHVLSRGEGILATNAMSDARFRSGDSVREYGIRTAICVPLRSGRSVLGALHIDSSVANFQWGDAELRLANHLGQHLGLALEGVELVRGMMIRERLAAMGETVANLSHSIKNILQGLRGGADAVELALERQDLAGAREGWPIVSRNLGRILSLTLNMLAWSKPRTLDLELTAVRPLFEEIASLVRPECERRGIRLTLDIEESMPPVPMDVNAIHQALTNLVTNAIDAVADRRGAIVLQARFDLARESAELSVADNGPGVPPEIREEMFEPFVTSKGQRGTGLGLAVSRQIVEEHGGAIGVQSEAGKGSVFTLVLPLAFPEDEKGRTAVPRPGIDVLEGELE